MFRERCECSTVVTPSQQGASAVDDLDAWDTPDASTVTINKYTWSSTDNDTTIMRLRHCGGKSLEMKYTPTHQADLDAHLRLLSRELNRRGFGGKREHRHAASVATHSRAKAHLRHADHPEKGIETEIGKGGER